MDAFPPDLLRWTIKHYFQQDALSLLRTCKILYYKLREDEKDDIRVQVFRRWLLSSQYASLPRGRPASCTEFMYWIDLCTCCNVHGPRLHRSPHAKYAVCPLSVSTCTVCGRSGIFASFTSGLCHRCKKPPTRRIIVVAGLACCALVFAYWKMK